MTGRNPWPPSAKRKTAKKRKLPKMTKQDKAQYDRMQEKLARARQLEPIRRAVKNVETALHSVELALGYFIHGKY